MDRATRTAWRLALVGVVLLMLAAGFIGTACPPAPTPDYADSLASVRHRYAADSAAWRVTVAGLQAVADSALRVSRTANAEAARLRGVRKEKPPTISYGTDTTLMVPKADYDSLAAEADSLWSVVRADSVVIAAQGKRIVADSLAYDALASLRADENRLHTAEATDLRAALAKANHKGCLLGFLPTPKPSVGYGLTLSEGRVVHGPTLSIAIPLRGC